VAIGLLISFMPGLHEIASFSWFIGVALGGGGYRWLAREDRMTAGATGYVAQAAAQKE